MLRGATGIEYPDEQRHRAPRLTEKTYQHYAAGSIESRHDQHRRKIREGRSLTLRDELAPGYGPSSISQHQRLLRKVTPMMERRGGGIESINITAAFGAAEPVQGWAISQGVLRAGLIATRLYATRCAAASYINNVLPGFIGSYPVMAERVENPFTPLWNGGRGCPPCRGCVVTRRRTPEYFGRRRSGAGNLTKLRGSPCIPSAKPRVPGNFV